MTATSRFGGTCPVVGGQLHCSARGRSSARAERSGGAFDDREWAATVE